MTVDLEILQGEKPNTLVAYASPGRFLGGSAKLATKFASLLLSPEDEVADRGTSFITNLRNGNYTTNARVSQAFALAESEIRQQLGDQSELPTSEQLDRAVLESFTFQSGTLVMRVLLQTPDGSLNIELAAERQV